MSRALRCVWSSAALSAAVWIVAAAPASASYDFLTHEFTTDDGYQTRSSFGCSEEGDVAVGGGVFSSGTYADGTYASESTPGTTGGGPKQGWTGQIDNYPGGPAQNIGVVHLTCAKNAKHDYDRHVENDGVQVPDNKLGGATLMCGNGQTVVGGGNDTSLNAGFQDETYLSMSAPVDGPDGDKIPDDGWRVEINNDEDAGQLTTKSDLYAICDKKHGTSAYRYVTSTEKVSDGTEEGAQKYCPKHEQAISGGVESKAPYKASMLVNSTYRFAAPDNRNGWAAYVDNYATPDGKTHKITVTAICKR